MLGSLSMEHSLLFQLERIQQQMSFTSASTSNGSSINMSAVDSGEGTCLQNVPVLFNDSETNLARMYGKFHKAASSIDQFRSSHQTVEEEHIHHLVHSPRVDKLPQKVEGIRMESKRKETEEHPTAIVLVDTAGTW
ncbi:Golgin subfamily A member 5 [Fukomys damarensis]|uniref:Golgin subfamily A member 5 n=1 Tax=Fukomys damarensis TaxID=885580 RepID=A0A091CPI9_FUKDA|nr:Golgin subfamily A member 5 [Fukomys damarensis]